MADDQFIAVDLPVAQHPDLIRAGVGDQGGLGPARRRRRRGRDDLGHVAAPGRRWVAARRDGGLAGRAVGPGADRAAPPHERAQRRGGDHRRGRRRTRTRFAPATPACSSRSRPGLRPRSTVPISSSPTSCGCSWTGGCDPMPPWSDRSRSPDAAVARAQPAAPPSGTTVRWRVHDRPGYRSPMRNDEDRRPTALDPVTDRRRPRHGHVRLDPRLRRLGRRALADDGRRAALVQHRERSSSGSSTARAPAAGSARTARARATAAGPTRSTSRRSSGRPACRASHAAGRSISPRTAPAPTATPVRGCGPPATTGAAWGENIGCGSYYAARRAVLLSHLAFQAREVEQRRPLAQPQEPDLQVGRRRRLADERPDAPRHRLLPSLDAARLADEPRSGASVVRPTSAKNFLSRRRPRARWQGAAPDPTMRWSSTPVSRA